MDVFGFKTRRLARTILEAVQPMFTTLERIHGITTRDIAADPYVLGFVNGVSILLARIESRGQLTTGQLGAVIIHVIQGVFGVDASQVKSLTLQLQEASNIEFARGRENADKLICITFGLDELRGDPDIEQARRDVVALRSVTRSLTSIGDDRSDLSACLQKKFFLDYVTKELLAK